MPRPTNVQSYTFTGVMPGGDSFAFGFWTANGAPDNFTEATAPAFAANSVTTDFMTAVQALNATGVVFNQIIFRAYGPAGQGAVLTSTASITRAGASAGGGPNQNALAITLKSAVANRRGRGRFFIPATSVNIGATTGRMVTSRAALLAATAAMLSQQDAVVVSEADGIARPVTRVEIGDVIDTMRSRRSKLVESRVTANVT